MIEIKYNDLMRDLEMMSATRRYVWAERSAGEPAERPVVVTAARGRMLDYFLRDVAAEAEAALGAWAVFSEARGGVRIEMRGSGAVEARAERLLRRYMVLLLAERVLGSDAEAGEAARHDLLCLMKCAENV